MMKRDMRRKDRQIDKEEIEKILKNNQYGILSTVSEDGYPYGLPLSYAYDNGKIYFHHTAANGLMKENIKNNEKVCFTVVGNTEVLPEEFSTIYESVIAFGTIKESQDKVNILMKLVKKYSPQFAEQGEKYANASINEVSVYELDIEQVTGKARKKR